MGFFSCCQKPEEDASPVVGQTTHMSCLRSILNWLQKYVCFNITDTNESSTTIVEDQRDGPSDIETGPDEKEEEIIVNYGGQEAENVKEKKGMVDDYIVNKRSDSDVNSESSFETHIVKAFIEDSSEMKKDNIDLKIIDFALVNPKSMSSNFSIKLDKNSNVHLDIHNIEMFDTLNLLNELRNYRNTTKCLQSIEQHIAFELLAAPISDNLELMFQDLDYYENNLLGEEYATISNTKQKPSDSTTLLKQGEKLTMNSQNKLSFVGSASKHVQTGVSQQHLSRNSQTVVKWNETSQNGHTRVNQNKKQISENVETPAKQCQKCIGQTSQTEETIDPNDNLICHSVEKIPGDGYMINKDVQIHVRHWHCLTGTKVNLRCEVCKCNFRKEYTTLHVTAKNHNERLQKCKPLRIFGLALMRKVDKECYHCAICNISLSRPWEHVQSAKHKSNLQGTQKEAALTRTKRTLENSQNIPAAEDLKTAFLEVTSLLKTGGGFVINKTVHLSPRCWNVFTGTNIKRYCNVCQGWADGKNGFFHFLSDQHKAKLSQYKFLKEFKMNLIGKLPDGGFYCGICGDKCENPTAHVLTKTHCTNYEASKKRAADALADPSKCWPVKL